MSVPPDWSTLTLTQGAVSVQVSIDAAHSLNHSDNPIPNYSVLRSLEGSAILHVRHPAARRAFRFSGEGIEPPALATLTIPGLAVLDCPTLDSASLNVVVTPMQVQRDAHGLVVGWTLECEEA